MFLKVETPKKLILGINFFDYEPQQKIVANKGAFNKGAGTKMHKCLVRNNISKIDIH